MKAVAALFIVIIGFKIFGAYANQLQPGQRYRLRVAGWRIPAFSSFPNILEVHDARTEQAR